MGLFDKKICMLCGEKASLLTKLKLSDGFLCSSCKKQLSDFTSGWSQRTFADVQNHLQARAQNAQMLTQFRPSMQGGTDGMVRFDPNLGRFIFAFGRDFEQGNPTLFQANQLVDFYIEPDVNVFSEDEDEDGIPDHMRRPANLATSEDMNTMNLQQTVNALAGGQYLRMGTNAYDEKGYPRALDGIEVVFVIQDPFVTEVRNRLWFGIGSDAPSQVISDAVNLMHVCEQIRSTAQQLPGGQFNPAAPAAMTSPPVMPAPSVPGVNPAASGGSAPMGPVNPVAPGAAAMAGGAKFCSSCGSALSPGSNFCAGCGSPVG